MRPPAILVISFSNLKTDPRVHRQLQLLRLFALADIDDGARAIGRSHGHALHRVADSGARARIGHAIDRDRYRLAAAQCVANILPDQAHPSGLAEVMEGDVVFTPAGNAL